MLAEVELVSVMIWWYDLLTNGLVLPGKPPGHAVVSALEGWDDVEGPVGGPVEGPDEVFSLSPGSGGRSLALMVMAIVAGSEKLLEAFHFYS